MSRLGDPSRDAPGRRAFTLIELLVVVAIIALLTGLLLPSLRGAREAGRGAVCASNTAQLALAASMYAGDFGDRAPPGAADFRANLTRWHGTRARTSDPFAPEGGALTSYLDGGAPAGGASRAVRTCPTFAGVLSRLAGSGRGFERSAGGYGYNNAFMGVDLAWKGGWILRSDRTGAVLARFQSPDATVMFADCAFPDIYTPDRMIEYSFAEPRFHAQFGDARMDPSIHFRHGARTASVAWLDGHVNLQKLSFTWSSGLYDPEAGEVGIGWFGEDDANTLFDFDAGGR